MCDPAEDFDGDAAGDGSVWGLGDSESMPLSTDDMTESVESVWCEEASVSKLASFIEQSREDQKPGDKGLCHFCGSKKVQPRDCGKQGAKVNSPQLHNIRC